MITIEVFGTTPPCAKCKRAEQEAQKAAARFPGQVQVLKRDTLGPEADRHGMMVTPTIVLNETVVANGRILSSEQLVPLIQKALGG